MYKSVLDKTFSPMYNETYDLSENKTINNSTFDELFSDNYVFPALRKSDLIFLLCCFGFCAVVTMLILGNRKYRLDQRQEAPPNLPPIPPYFRWTTDDAEYVGQDDFSDDIQYCIDTDVM